MVDEGVVEDEPAALADALKRAPATQSSYLRFPKENEVYFADGKAFLDSAPHYTPFSFEDVEFSEDVTTVEGRSPDPQEDETAGELDGTKEESDGTEEEPSKRTKLCGLSRKTWACEASIEIPKVLSPARTPTICHCHQPLRPLFFADI
jgi:hypothetical protein